MLVKEDDTARLLSEVRLLRHLPGDDIQALARHATLRCFGKGQVLFEEGGRPDCLFVLLDGMAELYATRKAREATILIMWPRSIFLPAAALTSERYLLGARALTDLKSLTLDAPAVRKEVEQSLRLANVFSRLLAAQFRLLVRQMKDHKLRSGPQRLCAFLCRVLRETGKNGYADLPVAKATLASRLGMTPESLSRALHLVEQHGIRVSGTRIILIDADRAHRFCDPDPLFDGPDQDLNINHF